MNQTLFWNAFNIKELAYQQCSLCVFALALYTFDEVGFAGGGGLCFILEMLRTHLWMSQPSRAVREVVSLQAWRMDGQELEEDMRQESQGPPNASPPSGQSLFGPVEASSLVLRARLNMDFFKAHHISPINKDPQRSQAAQLQLVSLPCKEN